MRAGVPTTLDTRLSAEDAALVSTIYDPPRARGPWTLREILPEGPISYYSLARWALVDALRACGVGRGDRVLVPALICREVMASINMLGATAVFYPVSDRLSAELTDESTVAAKAVLAVNYFGFPQDLGVFRSYCARTGAALIEDNAHGLFSRDADGRLLGSRGDAGVFTFRKTIAVPDGAALVLAADRRMPVPASAPGERARGARYRLKQGFRHVARAVGPRRTLATIEGLRTLRHSLPAGEATDAETHFPLSQNPGSWVSDSVTVAEPELEARRRRDLYDLASRILGRSGGRPVFRCLPPNVVPYGFPFFASPAHAGGITAELARHGLPLSQWPDLPAAIATSAPEHYRHLMVVPFLW